MTQYPEHILLRAQRAREKAMENEVSIPVKPHLIADPEIAPLLSEPDNKLYVSPSSIATRTAALNAAVTLYSYRVSYAIEDVIVATREFEKYLLEG